MSDTQFMFHCPDQVSDEELARLRGRITYMKMYPLVYGGAFAGGYYAVVNLLLKKYFHITPVVVFGLLGFGYGELYAKDDYMGRHATFKNMEDIPSRKKATLSTLPFNAGHFDVLLAHERR